MKTLTLLATVTSITATAFAGTTAEVMTPMAPAPAPTLGGWFVGGTFGQSDTDADLANGFSNDGDHYTSDDVDFNIYNLQIGRDLGMQVLGCDLAAYLEIGFAEGDGTVRHLGDNGYSELELQFVPITMNIKFERVIYGPVSAYLTGGVGYAFSNAKYSDGDYDNSDGGFYAQASAGLIYNISPQWEVFGGVRWMYLDDVGFGGDSEFNITLENDIAWEVGVRYNF
jgi:opacity protein-like surface antigen